MRINDRQQKGNSRIPLQWCSAGKFSWGIQGKLKYEKKIWKSKDERITAITLWIDVSLYNFI